MHIAFLTTEYPILSVKSGGIGIFIKHISHLLTKNDTTIKVSVIYWGNEIQNIMEDEGVSIIPIKRICTSYLSLYFGRKKLNTELNKILSEKKIDILESIDWEGALAFCRLKVPVVTRLHGSNVYFNYLAHTKTPLLIRILETNALQRSTAFIGVSKQALDISRKLFNIPINKKACVIYNPIDFDYISNFYQQEKKEQKDITILYYGTLVEKKGIFDIPKIFNTISERYDNIKLKLIGRDTIIDGISSWEKCQSLFSKHTMAKVEYLGVLPYAQTLACVNDSDICLFPNHAETFGLVLLEAMFLRKAIVCSDIDCFKEIADDRVEVLQCKVGDIDSFANALGLLIEHPAMRIQLGERAYKKAVLKFDSTLIAKQNITFYKKLIQNICKE